MITLINGHLQNQSGLVVAGGSVTFQLNVDANIIAPPGGLVLAGQKIIFQIDLNGNIMPPAGQTAAKIFSNAELGPQNSLGLGTYYAVAFYDANGARLNLLPLYWQFIEAAGSTVDLSQMTPYSTVGGNVIFYPIPGGGGGTVTSVAFAGDGTVLSATPTAPITASGILTATILSQNANTILAGPASGPAVAPTFRVLTAADLPMATTANHLTYSSGANALADVPGSAVTGATGAIALTAGAITTLPLQINAHSSSQTSPLLDVTMNPLSSSADAPVTIRGFGTGKWSQGGGTALLHVIADAPSGQAPVGLFVSNIRSGISAGGAPLGALAIFVNDTGVSSIAAGGGDSNGDYGVIVWGVAGDLTISNSENNNNIAATLTVQSSQSVTTHDIFHIKGTSAVLSGADHLGNWFWNGSTSGQAKIGAAAVAGTPNTLLLPTATATAGQFLSSNGANPQQLSWVTGVQEICSGQIALSTGAISSATRATNTLACPGLNASTDTINCVFSGDTNAVTGYAPSATGVLSLKVWASANTINVDQMNNTGSSITPGAATLNCKAVR